MRMTLFILYAAATMLLFTGAPHAQTVLEEFEPTEEISTETLLILHAAMPEFERRGLDISNYRAEIDRTESRIYVTFVDAEAPALSERRGVLGNPGKRVALSVELRRNDLQLVGSSFVK